MQEPTRSSSPSSNRGFKFKFKKRRVRYVALLPTTLTLCNGICGMLAIFQTAMGLASGRSDPIKTAGYLILIAMIFDALDGKVARITRTTSSFGAQLDSLCDLVTFGVAPSFLVFSTVTQLARTPAGLFQYWLPERIVLVVCVFYAMCALIRLARFTAETTPDEKSHLEFQGLPSPAAAGVVAASVIPWHAFPEFPAVGWIADLLPKALPVMTFLVGILMVSRIRYVHLVNRVFRGFRPFVTLVELALVAIFLVVLYEFAIFAAFVVYAATGPILWIVNRVLRRGAPAPETTVTEQLPQPKAPEDPLF